MEQQAQLGNVSVLALLSSRAGTGRDGQGREQGRGQGRSKIRVRHDNGTVVGNKQAMRSVERCGAVR